MKTVIIIRRDHGLLQLIVEKRGVFRAIIDSSLPRGAVSDGPARDPFDMPLDPPAVQNAQARHAVERRLHAARPGGFERRLGRIQPHVDARRH